VQKFAPWVLKDVRFARTLPLWWPLLSRPLCIIPFRHPVEVADSSVTQSISIWENYMVSALTASARLNCPVHLVSYDRWLHDARAQFASLHEFMRCNGVPGLPDQPPYDRLEAIIDPREKHHDADSLSATKCSGSRAQTSACTWSSSSKCLWEQLEQIAKARGAAARPGYVNATRCAAVVGRVRGEPVRRFMSLAKSGPLAAKSPRGR